MNGPNSPGIQDLPAADGVRCVQEPVGAGVTAGRELGVGRDPQPRWE